MRDQLIHYVDLLFAGAPEAADIKQEILQNTLDRYDDLVSQGKNPQAAYSLAIAGIGDVSELFGTAAAPVHTLPTESVRNAPPEQPGKPLWKKILTVIAIFLYIIAIIPLIVLSEMNMDTLGLCGTISIAAVATVVILVGSGGKQESHKDEEKQNAPLTPQQEMKKAIKKTISTVGLVIYFVISFATGAWHITWLIFPIIAAIEGVVNASLDLKGAKDRED